MIQLILHLVGDYVTQSDWMANNKRSNSVAALCHVGLYSLPFIFIGSPKAVFVIWATHFLIDRFGLARYVVWAKNWMGPWKRRETKTEAINRAKAEGRVSSAAIFEGTELCDFLDDYKNNPRYICATLPWHECKATGYPPERPAWLAVWLLIAADNTIHLAINYAALRWL